MPERQGPTLDQIAMQWLCLWQMGLQLLAFTPAAFARELAQLNAGARGPRCSR